MDTASILNELRAERDRINQAIAALEALSAPQAASPKRRGRKPAAATAAAKPTSATQTAAKQPRAGRRRLSAAARKRISEAAKRRWAAQKSKSAGA